MKVLRLVAFALFVALLPSPSHGEVSESFDFERSYWVTEELEVVEPQPKEIHELVPTPKFVMLDKEKVVFEFNLAERFFKEALTARVHWNYCCDGTEVIVNLRLIM